MNIPMSDFFEIYTASEAEREYKDFKFKGVGWYIVNLEDEGTSYMFVGEYSSTKFAFHHFSEDPRPYMKEVVEAPVREDETL